MLYKKIALYLTQVSAVVAILCTTNITTFAQTKTDGEIQRTIKKVLEDYYSSNNRIDSSPNQQKSRASTRHQDSLNLIAIHSDLHENGDWYNEWDYTQPIDTWYGISLSSNQERVISINLGSNNLKGVIPQIIGDLSELIVLSLQHNDINSEIPPGIYNLDKLQILYLHDNELSGNIMPEISNLTPLKYCRFSYNNLTGAIPTDLGQLNNLVHFFTNDNNHSGSVPPLGTLENLKKGYFNDNQLSGNLTDDFQNMDSLKILDLSYNNLSGCVPESLSGLSSIQTLNFKYNDLQGPFPESLTSLCSNNINVVFNQNPLLSFGGYFQQFCNGSIQTLPKCCDADNLIIGYINQNEFRANEVIELSANNTHNYSELIFTAGTNIHIEPGFHNNIGTIISATIGNCLETTTSIKSGHEDISH